MSVSQPQLTRNVEPVAEQSKPGKQTSRLRVLLAAYTCTPGLPSEPGVGWNNIVQAARFHDVWVITSAGNRKHVESELAINPLPNVEWVYINLPKWLSWYLTGEKGGRIHYYLYQIVAYQKAKTLHEQIGFDIVHHINYVSYWTPVFLSRLSAPFIWGPVGGAESAPAAFYKTLNLRAVFFERLRDTVRWLAHNFDPFVRETAQNAAISLATTLESAKKMQELGANPVELLPAICMTDGDLSSLVSIEASTNADFIQFVSIGRFLGWKGYHLSLEAFARFHTGNPNSRYVMVGQGQQLEALQALTMRLDITHAVTFTGFIPHTEVMKKLAESDVLVHPSLHDSGGAICLEAMAAGRAVLCLNLGGPALLVTKETGIIVSAETPETAIQEMADAMQLLATNTELRTAMGKKGREHVLEYYVWHQRGDYLNELYCRIYETQQLKAMQQVMATPNNTKC